MKIEKYNPSKVSNLRKWIYTLILIIIAPATLLLSLFFIHTVWSDRKWLGLALAIGFVILVIVTFNSMNSDFHSQFGSMYK